jgi:hypothetical protein
MKSLTRSVSARYAGQRSFLSELPPPPAPTVHAVTTKRLSRLRLLRDGIHLRISASGRRAFSKVLSSQ